MAWAGIPAAALSFSTGTPSEFASSQGAIRTFCPTCGTSLTIHIDEFSDETYVSISAFDDPAAVKPEAHIWTSEKPDWLVLGDDLPRYRRFKADEQN